jgi:hypothetical protein
MTLIATCFLLKPGTEQHKAGISKSGTQSITQQEQLDEFWHSAKHIKAGAP